MKNKELLIFIEMIMREEDKKDRRGTERFILDHIYASGFNLGPKLSLRSQCEAPHVPPASVHPSLDIVMMQPTNGPF